MLDLNIFVVIMAMQMAKFCLKSVECYLDAALDYTSTQECCVKSGRKEIS